MRTREGHHLEVVSDSRPPTAPTVDTGAGPDDADPAGPPRPRLALAVGLAVALVLASAASLAMVLTGGDDDVVRSDPPAAVQPAGPAALGIAVDVPASVVAGEPAQLTVSWTDGTGIFSGSSEDWGDAVATSSRKQGRCEPGAPAEPAAAGTYHLLHTWSEPGTYAVVVGVATYTCADGSAVEEEASKTLTIEVRPAG